MVGLNDTIVQMSFAASAWASMADARICRKIT
jgi:hypothetical protein